MSARAVRGQETIDALGSEGWSRDVKASDDDDLLASKLENQ